MNSVPRHSPWISTDHSVVLTHRDPKAILRGWLSWEMDGAISGQPVVERGVRYDGRTGCKERFKQNSESTHQSQTAALILSSIWLGPVDVATTFSPVKPQIPPSLFQTRGLLVISSSHLSMAAHAHRGQLPR